MSFCVSPSYRGKTYRPNHWTTLHFFPLYFLDGVPDFRQIILPKVRWRIIVWDCYYNVGFVTGYTLMIRTLPS